jgi:hypothetical protein
MGRFALMVALVPKRAFSRIPLGLLVAAAPRRKAVT